MCTVKLGFFSESLGEHKRSSKPKTLDSLPLTFFAIQNLFSNCFSAKTVSRTEKFVGQKM